MQTGENEQGLRKILDMTRLISIILLMLHWYYFHYQAFVQWQWTTRITDQLLLHLSRTGLFADFHLSKGWALGFLLVSLIGAKGRKDEKLTLRIAVQFFLPGLGLYFGSYYWIVTDLTVQVLTLAYGCTTGVGYLLMLTGGTYLSRIIRRRLAPSDIFNKDNETFPQEERLLNNEYSVNLPARYRFKNQVRKSWINIINPFRSVLVMGSPGSGKSYFVIRHVITQHLAKGFSMFIYDFKFDDLSVIAYNHFLRNQNKFRVPPSFYVINFDDLSRSHRCNPLEKKNMSDITDAAESARTILLGLNREWIRKQGDFFVESPINFFTAIIWFLRRYRDGEYLLVPHAIELA